MSASYCLIGHPLGHSLSPFIHKRLFALSDKCDDYVLCDIAPETLTEQLAVLLPTVKGMNITIPYKQQIQPFLTAQADGAIACGAVNCIAVTKDGIIGHNTDTDGFLKALDAADIRLNGRVLIVGAGGAGSMFAVEAAKHNCTVVLCNPRNLERAKALADRIRADFPTVSCQAVDTPLGDFDLIINATPVGMYPHTDACPLFDDVLAHTKAAFDAIYNPRETVFLQKAAANGAKTAGGMAMLVWQAVVSHEIWYGATFDTADIAALIEDCYAELNRFQPKE